MKKILIICLAIAIFSCNNASDADQDKNDSLNMHTNQNTDNEADRIPYDKKDTASYENMPNRDSTK